jgi:hypothetical protein
MSRVKTGGAIRRNSAACSIEGTPTISSAGRTARHLAFWIRTTSLTHTPREITSRVMFMDITADRFGHLHCRPPACGPTHQATTRAVAPPTSAGRRQEFLCDPRKAESANTPSPRSAGGAHSARLTEPATEPGTRRRPPPPSQRTAHGSAHGPMRSASGPDGRGHPGRGRGGRPDARR